MLFPALIASCFSSSHSLWMRDNYNHNLQVFQSLSPEINALISELMQFTQELSWVLSDEEKRSLPVFRNQFVSLNSLLIGSRSWKTNNARHIRSQFMAISSTQQSIISLCIWFYKYLRVYFPHDITRLSFDENEIQCSFLKESMNFLRRYITWRRNMKIMWTTRQWFADILNPNSPSEQ